MLANPVPVVGSCWIPYPALPYHPSLEPHGSGFSHFPSAHPACVPQVCPDAELQPPPYLQLLSDAKQLNAVFQDASGHRTPWDSSNHIQRIHRTRGLENVPITSTPGALIFKLLGFECHHWFFFTTQVLVLGALPWGRGGSGTVFDTGNGCKIGTFTVFQLYMARSPVRSFLLLVVRMPLVAIKGAPSSVLAPSGSCIDVDARSS